jgi:HNH endonuclease
VLEDAARNPVTLRRTVREPSEAMMRALRYRDAGCRFPGCGNQRFTHAHHLVWWGDGGRTDLDNLILLCTFHHKLVHELGWTVGRGSDGSLEWRDRGGQPHRSGPAPPEDGAERRPLAAVGSGGPLL